jgi:hypothetical protein
MSVARRAVLSAVLLVVAGDATVYFSPPPG